MDNENKWEYDYSSSNGSADTPSEDIGYVNVGSSGTNSANLYETARPAVQPDPAPAAQTADPAAETEEKEFYQTFPQRPRSEDVPPPPPPQNTDQSSAPAGKSRRPKSRWAGRVLRAAALLALAFVFGMAGGYWGSRLSARSGAVVIQSVERDPSVLSASSTSTAGNDLTLPQVSALVGPSVVVITTEQVVYSNWSWFGQNQVQSGAGSGVILSADGYILTCAHVVSGASNVTVTIGEKDYPATIIGQDADSDVAVIKIEASDLTPAVIGNSDALSVGENVVAVGNPLGTLGGTVTNGIVSALNRSLVVENKKHTLIQTNASISPGNSGGGLFNMAGELVGMVNAKSASSSAEGLGFAIPINAAMQVAQDLLERGYVSGRPWLGVVVYNVDSVSAAQQLGVNSYGVYIVEITSGGAADKAGLKAGDRIVSIEGREVAVNSDVTDIIQEHLVGDRLEFLIVRGGQLLTVQVTLGERTAADQ